MRTNTWSGRQFRTNPCLCLLSTLHRVLILGIRKLHSQPSLFLVRSLEDRVEDPTFHSEKAGIMTVLQTTEGSFALQRDFG